MKIAFSLFACILLAASCTKDKETTDTPSTSVTGFWAGIAGERVILFNQAPNKARLYHVYPGTDTSAATRKFPGTYTFNGKTYSGRFVEGMDTLYLEFNLVGANRLSGVYSYTTGELGLSEIVRLY